MSALTERVAREHRPYRDPVAPGRLWLCECDGGNASRDIVAHVYHIAAVTERAVRASVAAEIRAERTQVLTGDVAGQFEAAALGLAARIAEGKQL